MPEIHRHSPRDFQNLIGAISYLDNPCPLFSSPRYSVLICSLILAQKCRTDEHCPAIGAILDLVQLLRQSMLTSKLFKFSTDWGGGWICFGGKAWEFRQFHWAQALPYHDTTRHNTHLHHWHHLPRSGISKTGASSGRAVASSFSVALGPICRTHTSLCLSSLENRQLFWPIIRCLAAENLCDWKTLIFTWYQLMDCPIFQTNCSACNLGLTPGQWQR